MSRSGRVTGAHAPLTNQAQDEGIWVNLGCFWYVASLCAIEDAGTFSISTPIWKTVSDCAQKYFREAMNPG